MDLSTLTLEEIFIDHISWVDKSKVGSNWRFGFRKED